MLAYYCYVLRTLFSLAYVSKPCGPTRDAVQVAWAPGEAPGPQGAGHPHNELVRRKTRPDASAVPPRGQNLPNKTQSLALLRFRAWTLGSFGAVHAPESPRSEENAQKIDIYMHLDHILQSIADD